jgi:hypothetical protein
VAIRERALGPDHPDTARDRAALAALLDGQARHAEAEALHRAALDVLARAGDDREVAYVLDNLAACLHSSGRTAEAEPLARRAVLLMERTLGARHPDLDSARSNLAVIQDARARVGQSPPRAL